jgi:hypothetical protein
MIVKNLVKLARFGHEFLANEREEIGPQRIDLDRVT